MSPEDGRYERPTGQPRRDSSPDPGDEPGAKPRIRSRWLRGLLPVAAAAAVLAVPAGTALALRHAGPGSEGAARAGPEPRLVSPMAPSGGRNQPGQDQPVSTSVPGAEPTGPAQPTATTLDPRPPNVLPGGPGSGEAPWPGNGRPMTGPWAEVSPNGRAVTVHFFGAPSTPRACGSGYTATVRETAAEIRVRIHEYDLGDARLVACPEFAQARSVTVALDRPLGDRAVLRMPEHYSLPVRGR